MGGTSHKPRNQPTSTTCKRTCTLLTHPPLTILARQFFATKTDASVLRMLNGSPAERLLAPITDYIQSKGGRIHVRTGCKWVRCCWPGLECSLCDVGMRMSRTEEGSPHMRTGCEGVSGGVVT